MNPEYRTSLTKFYFMLLHHDWHYQYSDDYGVWQKGSNERGRLEHIALETDEHAHLFRAFHDFANGKGPKPECPKEEP